LANLVYYLNHHNHLKSLATSVVNDKETKAAFTEGFEIKNKAIFINPKQS